MNYTDLVKQIWDQIYGPNTKVVNVIENFFHQGYEQCINGVVMNRSQYVDHVLEQRKSMTVDSIDYKHMLEKENEFFAIYYPIGKNANNLPLQAEVIAYFRFEGRKIHRIHGQVRLISGDLSDVDM